MEHQQQELSLTSRRSILLAAFLAWMFAGLVNALFVLIHRQMMQELLGRDATETLITRWFAWNQAAFMLGAAAGGWCFGWLGDKAGRTRALGWSVLCFSLLTLVGWFVTDSRVMWVLRFFACMGFGGTWPNAVALVSEVWPRTSRPLLAGLLGTAANFGFVLLGLIGYVFPITSDSWRWTLLVGGAPAVPGLIILLLVPESPRWRQEQQRRRAHQTAFAPDSGSVKVPGTPAANISPIRQLFQPPLLSRTCLGILLGSIPVIGTAANANWVIPWTDQYAARQADAERITAEQPQADASSTSTGSERRVNSAAKPRPTSRDKAWQMVSRSSGAILGSLLGGLIASIVGRRLSYFLISFATFLVSTWLFTQLTPGDPWFSWCTFLLGFFGVSYFGWLPLFLPELFPVAVRSTGSGISFNSGRIAAAAVVLYVGLQMQSFQGDYARIGFATGFVYVLGMLVIWLAPARPDDSGTPARAEDTVRDRAGTAEDVQQAR